MTILFACIGVIVSSLGIIVPALLVVIGSVRKLGLLEGLVTSSIAELRKSVDELRDGLKQLTKIPELDRRVCTLEDTVSKLSKTVHSTDKFRAVNERDIQSFKKQLDEVKERSNPDLSRFVSPNPPTRLKP